MSQSHLDRSTRGVPRRHHYLFNSESQNREASQHLPYTAPQQPAHQQVLLSPTQHIPPHTLLPVGSPQLPLPGLPALIPAPPTLSPRGTPTPSFPSSDQQWLPGAAGRRPPSLTRLVRGKRLGLWAFAPAVLPWERSPPFSPQSCSIRVVPAASARRRLLRELSLPALLEQTFRALVTVRSRSHLGGGLGTWTLTRLSGPGRQRRVLLTIVSPAQVPAHSRIS